MYLFLAKELFHLINNKKVSYLGTLFLFLFKT